MVPVQSPIMTAHMTAIDKPQHLRHILSYTVPGTVLAYYILALTISVLTLQNLKAQDRKTPCKVLLWLIALVLLSYIIEAGLLLTDTFANEALNSSTDCNVSPLFHTLYEVNRSSLADEPHRYTPSRTC